MPEPQPRQRRPLLPHLRAVGAALAVLSGVRGLYDLRVTGFERQGWLLLLAAIVISAAASAGLNYPTPPPLPPRAPASMLRRILGSLLALAGAALWAVATRRIYEKWVTGFDFAWMGWTSAVVLMAIGLDLAWGTWPRARERRWSTAVLVSMGVLLALAALYRLGNIADFPGEAAVTQIEDLQVGNFGWSYLQGYRLRWEYLSSTWLAALGIWLGGPTQMAVRIPFATVSALKVLPLFVWLRLSVGTAGALVGTALLACSFWDVVLSRIPNNHNALIVSIVFALLAGPARRGRPSAYVLLGFFGGYVLHEYVAYRPLAALAVVGAIGWSLRDSVSHWTLRVARPLITVVLLVTMVIPLFYTRLPGGLRVEYFDGWNRARGITEYYNPDATWTQAINRRIDRAFMVADLFTVHGDRSPVRNIGSQPPLIEAVTCVLLLLGIGAAAANALRPVFGLTVLGCAITVSGTLILTGNFDVARVGGAVPYVYVLAGIGAAGLWTTWSQAWGRAGRALATLGLAIAVAYAGVVCTRYAFELWSDPVIRRAHRNNLAYLTAWMRDHVRADESVMGIAPGYENVLGGHDGSFLRGRTIDGYVGWDIESVLRRWVKEPGPTVLFVFTGHGVEAVGQFLEKLLGLKFEFDIDPLAMSGDVTYTRAPGPPPELAQQLAEWHCRGVHEEFAIIGADNKPMFKVAAVAPFIDKSTWPGAIPEELYRLSKPPASIQAHYSAPFTVDGGEYRFLMELYVGTAQLLIDGVKRNTTGREAVPLSAGLHQLEVNAQFAPMAAEPAIRLLWSGPDTGNRQELMPFYRLSPLDPSCSGAAGQEPFAATGHDGRPGYLLDWLTAGPFPNPNDSGLQREFIDVAQLTAHSAAAAGQQWEPAALHGAFVNFGEIYPSTAPDRNPQWMCAYAATRIESPIQRRAFLELAGSGDRLRVWLNGAEVTAMPLVAGYEPQRHAIELRAGANLLVVKSCADVGAWYFVARIADGSGHAFPDLRSSAALPNEVLTPAPTAVGEPVQLIDGFGSMVSAPHDQPDYPDHRGGGPSSWAYADDPQAAVVWRTAPAPAQRATVIALTASTSEVSGEGELFVNGKSVIVFPVGTESIDGHWKANGYEMAFVSRGYHGGNAGLLLITVPAEVVTAGEPIQLRVMLKGGAPKTWFMVKNYADTVAYEELSPRVALELLRPEWEGVPRGVASR